jgi:uncharacterized protein (UPF0333 family)
MFEPVKITNNISLAWQVAIIVFFVIIFIAWFSIKTSESQKKEDIDLIILQAIAEMENRMNKKDLAVKRYQKKEIELQNKKLDQILIKLNSLK